ncbi:hypothetical protein [uncultured Imperialibacter sp.]|uniref:hypothetical protein n=1 Tax=uncultured Imperialibacter sp. TaxID=1672639 RepID=UPI0030DC8983|tara:strand:- start:1751 stop:2458 length:708 start_codon:yes stop_codon:yes gene_type:complete
MNIETYFTEVNSKCQEIFRESMKEKQLFGNAHHLSTCIYDFSNFIADSQEKELIGTVSSQLEAATLSLGLGLYRQAFSTLRLAFEMGLSVAYFSIHKLEHIEWLSGKSDIKWSKLIDEENGVLSKRFVSAFFPELDDFTEEYLDLASKSYRTLSEFVHGNFQTWIKSGIVIKMNSELLKSYFELFSRVSETLLFVYCCRYLKTFPTSQLDSMEFVSEELNFIGPIRELMGGPKEL